MEQDKNEEPPPPSISAPPAEEAKGTGLYYKDGREIPPTHPDHGPMHLLPRQEDGSFAAYYYCSKAELYDAQIPAPPPRRHRRDGFTLERQEQFLEYVRGGASGREAARRVGISPTTAYNLYNSPDGAAFRAGWDEAARVTDIVLEDTAYDRAVNGQEEIVYHKGEQVGTRVRYDNALLMKLLRARNPLRYAPLSEIEGWLRHRGVAPPADVDGALGRLRESEAQWGRRLPGEEAPARLADPSGAGPRPQPLLPEPMPPQASDPSTSSTSSEPGQAENASAPSTSSTSPGTGQPENASASSTSPGTGQPENASAASTSSESGQPDDSPDPSTSSTSPAIGQEPGQPPPAPDRLCPEDPPGLYRPPPRPRITLL